VPLSVRQEVAVVRSEAVARGVDAGDAVDRAVEGVLAVM